MLSFLKKNILLIIIIANISFIVISPWLLTFPKICDNCDFSGTGQIGDTIGGITSPFINVLNAILIFFAYKQQLVANEHLKSQIESEKTKAKDHLDSLKKLILFDLEYKILPSVLKIEKEIEKYLNTQKDT